MGQNLRPQIPCLFLRPLTKVVHRVPGVPLFNLEGRLHTSYWHRLIRPQTFRAYPLKPHGRGRTNRAPRKLHRSGIQSDNKSLNITFINNNVAAREKAEKSRLYSSGE